MRKKVIKPLPLKNVENRKKTRRLSGVFFILADKKKSVSLQMIYVR